MQINLGDVVAPVVVATLFIIATSAFKEPQRRNFNPCNRERGTQPEM
jgi:hypothetical protein